MALVIPSIFSAVDKMSAPMRAMGNSVASFAAKAESSIQRADRSMNKYFSVLSHAQKELLETVSVAAIAYKGIEAVEFGFDAVKEYDEAITKLQTNFRLSDSALVPFKKNIMDVANESYKSASEVTEVFNVIGSKNRELLNQPEALTAMSKSAITLSEALKTDLIPTTEQLTSIMAGFKITDSEKAIDAIAAASSSGAVKGLELTEALKSISAEAMHAHLSLGQAAGMIEFIDKKTQGGGEASTALLRTFLTLEKSGLAYKNGVFNMGYAIDRIQGQMKGMGDIQKNLFLAETLHLATPKAIKAARALFEPGAAKELLEYQKQTELTGIAEQMAAKNTGTLAVALERVKAAFGNAFVESDKVGTGMNHLKNILKFVYTNMNSILTVIGYLIAAFVAWKTVVLGMQILSVVLQGWAIFANLAQVAMWGLNIAMDANPAGLIALAIIALGVALYEAYQHCETFRVGVNALLDTFTDFYKLVVPYIKTIWEIMVKFFNITKDAGNSVEQYFLNQWIAPIEKVIGRMETLRKIYHDIKAAIPGALTTAAISAIPGGGLINAVRNTDAYKKNYEAELAKETVAPAINSKKAEQDALHERIETTQKQNIKMEIGLGAGLNGAIVTNPWENIHINTSSTHAQV